jgi:hypothetical protein
MFRRGHQRLGPIGRERDAVTVSRNVEAEEIADLRVVVDDQHGSHGGWEHITAP